MKLLETMTNSVGINTPSAQIVISKSHLLLRELGVLEEVAVSSLTAKKC